ncbi:MAG: hypothetical protein IJL52_09220 [Clostridia bacterium]|nr:hypothetical protein [Clostridia bacterium]
MNRFTKSMTAMIGVLLMLASCFSGCEKGSGDAGQSGAKETPAVIYSEQELLKMLDEKLADRAFSDIANDYFRECLSLVYRNYDVWQNAYKDLPPVSEYIQTNLIDVIDNISGVRMLDERSKKATKLLERGEAGGFTDLNFRITVIYIDEKNATEHEHLCDLETFLHECAHCANPGVFNQSYYLDNFGIRYWFTEGEATFHSKFILPLPVYHSTTWCIETEDGSRWIEYCKDSGVGYLTYLYMYENLLYLAGYDAMHAVGRTADLSVVKDEIAKRYGADTQQALWDKLMEWYNSYSQNWRSDQSYQLAIELQALFSDCVKQDIHQLDTSDKAQVLKFMDVYRNYKLNILPVARDAQDTPCTDAVFGVGALDDLMIEKIVQADAMRFCDDDAMNRMALRCVLHVDRECLDGPDFHYLPQNIRDTQYGLTISEVDGQPEGRLHLTYSEPDYNAPTRAVITFNAQTILSIALDG